MAKNRKALKNSSVFSESLVMKSSPQSASCTPTQKDPPSSPQTTQYGPGAEGLTYELCAGIVDKPVPLEQIAKEELLEETGYDVPLEGIQEVTGYCSSIGTSGSHQTMFYCAVTDDMHVEQGGGNAAEGEMINVIHIPASKALEFALDASKVRTSGLCFAFLWFDKIIRPTLTQTTSR